jgi:hypothetical protein
VQSSGSLLNPEDRSKSVGRVFTVIDLAEHWQWLAVVRRIILRMHAWLNYVA